MFGGVLTPKFYQQGAFVRCHSLFIDFIYQVYQQILRWNPTLAQSIASQNQPFLRCFYVTRWFSIAYERTQVEKGEFLTSLHQQDPVVRSNSVALPHDL